MAASPAPFDASQVLQSLIDGKDLSSDVAYEFASALAHDRVSHIQVAGVLTLLASKPESPVVLASFVRAMREVCVAVVPPPGLAPLVDIVGTGGDGHNTVNISTAAAILASACGATIAKHGSISSSSLSGAADVLGALGVTTLQPADVPECLSRARLAFMFAPLHHPGLRAAVPVRRALKVRTLLNVLGPLLNPAGATRLVLGVYRPSLLPVYADALVALGTVEHALVVHCGGLDEFAPIGATDVAEVRREASGGAYACTYMRIDPADWGVPRCSITDLVGGGPAENAATLRAVLGGGEGFAERLDATGHVGRTIALNAGAALYVAGRAESVAAGYAAALAGLARGEGLVKLDEWVAATREIVATTVAAQVAAGNA